MAFSVAVVRGGLDVWTGNLTTSVLDAATWVQAATGQDSDVIEIRGADTYVSAATIPLNGGPNNRAGVTLRTAPGVTATVQTTHTGPAITVSAPAAGSVCTIGSLTGGVLAVVPQANNIPIYAVGAPITSLTLLNVAADGGNSTAAVYYYPSGSIAGRALTMRGCALVGGWCNLRVQNGGYARVDYTIEDCTFGVPIFTAGSNGDHLYLATYLAGHIKRCSFRGHCILGNDFTPAPQAGQTFTIAECLDVVSGHFGAALPLGAVVMNHDTGGQAKLVDCTVVCTDAALKAAGASGTKINVAGGPAPDVRNLILDGWAAGHNGIGAAYTPDYCCYHSCTARVAGAAVSGAHDFDADPLYVDAAGGDYQLAPLSPCLDAGPDTGESPDLLGIARPQGVARDTGCYERIYIPPAQSPAMGLIHLTMDGEHLATSPSILDLIPSGSAADDAPQSLMAATLIALLSDRRAMPDDVVPGRASGPSVPATAVPQDRGGWWGDAYDPQGRLLGSRLWLVVGAGRVTTEAVRRVREYAEEALAYLKTDGIVARIDVTASRLSLSGGQHGVSLDVTYYRRDGAKVAVTFPDLWAAIESFTAEV